MRVLGLGRLTVVVVVSANCLAYAPQGLVDLVKRGGNVASVASLLDQHVDVNERERDGTSALHWAAHSDDLRVAELLIRAGADVNAANIYGVTPLSLAC